jgi:hypothetical protein
MCCYNGRMYKQVHSLMCFLRLAKMSLVYYCQDVVLFNAYPRNCRDLVCPQQVILYKLLMFIVYARQWCYWEQQSRVERERKR